MVSLKAMVNLNWRKRRNKRIALKSEAISLLENPTLTYIFFAPNGLSEVGITSHIPQLNNNILGYIDRLIIE